MVLDGGEEVRRVGPDEGVQKHENLGENSEQKIQFKRTVEREERLHRGEKGRGKNQTNGKPPIQDREA